MSISRKTPPALTSDFLLEADTSIVMEASARSLQRRRRPCGRFRRRPTAIPSRTSQLIQRRHSQRDRQQTEQHHRIQPQRRG